MEQQDIKLTGNFEQDMANIAASQGVVEAQATPAEQEPTPEPTQTPVVTQEVATPTTPEAQAEKPATEPIPEKFLNPDGTPAVDKINKAALDAESAYAKYREREIELKRKMNEVNKLKTGAVQPQAQQPQNIPSAPPNTFEAQIEADVRQHGIGVTLSKLFEAAQQAAYERAVSDIHDIRTETELSKSQRELEAIAKLDPFILSPEGVEELSRRRNDKPWLNASPEPWKAAYRDYLADRALQNSLNPTGQVKSTPNPTGVTAPITPVTPAPRAQAATGINLQNASKEDLNAYLHGKSAEEQAKIFAQLGLRMPEFPKYRRFTK